MRAPAAATVLALLLTGCTGGDGPSSPEARAAEASASASPAVPASARLLAEADDEAAPLASAEGDLPLLGEASSPVRVDVLEVRAGVDSTLLRWRLSSRTGERVDTYTSALSRPIGFDSRQVALVSADQRLQPFTYVPQQGVTGTDVGCVCSGMPQDVGPEGVAMTALYPPLSAGTEQVDVVLPGVVELTGVPVTR